jgi:hypothetical protein
MERKGATADHVLMQSAGWTIIHAAYQGLTDFLFDFERLLPEGRMLLDHYREGIASSAMWPEANASSSAFDQEPQQTSNPNAGDGTSLPAASGDQPAEGNAVDWEQRDREASDRLAAIAKEIEAHGDPAGEAAEGLFRGVRSVVSAAWDDLSSRFPGDLSPETARIKNELLPGVDPWFGLPRDFRKASWVCEFMARKIEERWDRLTMTAAAKQYDVPYDVIWRAYRGKKSRKPPLEVVGKCGREYVITRKSFLKWYQEYRVKKTKENQTGQTHLLIARDYQCGRLECDWVSEAKLKIQPTTCPKCGHKSVRSLIRPQAGKKKRN